MESVSIDNGSASITLAEQEAAVSFREDLDLELRFLAANAALITGLEYRVDDAVDSLPEHAIASRLLHGYDPAYLLQTARLLFEEQKRKAIDKLIAAKNRSKKQRMLNLIASYEDADELIRRKLRE